MIELDEAFVAQALAVMRESQIDFTDDRINPHGSGISLGHPVGATGGCMLASLTGNCTGATAGTAITGLRQRRLNYGSDQARIPDPGPGRFTLTATATSSTCARNPRTLSSPAG